MHIRSPFKQDPPKILAAVRMRVTLSLLRRITPRACGEKGMRRPGKHELEGSPPRLRGEATISRSRN